MRNNILKTILILTIVLISFYLLLPEPSPELPLPNSYKSTEAGDTGQIPGLYAYYTNLSREEVINFYRKSFSASAFLKIPLPILKLNHPPEYAWEVIINTVHSTFLEELVHPFRESLFINGDEPSQDPFLRNWTKRSNFFFEGQEYDKKIIIYRRGSNPIGRFVIFWLGIILLKWLLGKVRNIYESIRHRS